MIQWSPKQQQVIDTIVQGTARVVVVIGPVQSGKTLACTFGLMLRATMNYSGEDWLLATSSRKQLQGSMLKYAQQFSDMTGGGWRRREDWYQSRSAKGGFNRWFPLLGRVRGSEGQARSFAAQGVLMDEATLLDEQFINSVEDRASKPDAIVVYAANPAGPMHPIKQKLVDKADGKEIVHIPFQLSDNRTLTIITCGRWSAGTAGR